MTQLYQLLVERLEKKGLAPATIPRFLRDVAYIVSDDPYPDLMELNDRLHSLGWNTVELDYQTWELISANSEAEA